MEKFTISTYNTIQEAFANGQGDVFFKKDSKFVAFSRKDDRDQAMKSAGFKRLTYDEVIALSLTDTSAASAGVWAKAKMAKADQGMMLPESDSVLDSLRAMKNEMAAAQMIRREQVQSRSTCESYYEEFPDAYGQSL